MWWTGDLSNSPPAQWQLGWTSGLMRPFPGKIRWEKWMDKYKKYQNNLTEDINKGQFWQPWAKFTSFFFNEPPLPESHFCLAFRWNEWPDLQLQKLKCSRSDCLSTGHVLQSTRPSKPQGLAHLGWLKSNQQLPVFLWKNFSFRLRISQWKHRAVRPVRHIEKKK